MRAKKLLAVGGVLCCMLAAVSTAFAGAGITKVTIRPATSTISSVHGRIFSKKTACVGGRTINVFKQKGNSGKATQVATTTSTKHGTYGLWSITTTLGHGTYYAEATKTSKCRAAISSTVVIK